MFHRKALAGQPDFGLAGRPYVALGIFDGVHLGHQHILRAMVKAAKASGTKAICITFFPHPSKILNSKHIFVNLISLPHRLNLISRLGVDACIVINFNRVFSRISAEHFIELLYKKINPSFIFIGSNFTFGRGGLGNTRLLKRLAVKYGFKVKVFSPLKLKHNVISSTFIRSLIKEGKLGLAKKYLGRDVSILGRVVRGKQIGRKLGYHTANIDTEHEIIPPRGIYAVKIKIENKQFNGAAYIGTSPTLHLGYRLPRLEVYILNFHRNIYGKRIEVDFVRKIREEKELPSLNILSAQIKQDILNARSILS